MQNKQLELTLFDKTFEFPNDIIEYINLLNECDKLLQSFHGNILKRVKSTKYFLNDDDFKQDYLLVSNVFVKKLCDKNIFSISSDDFIFDNIGVKTIENINSEALNKFKDLLLDEMDNFMTQVSDAEQRAKGSITGSGVSVFSSSLLTLTAASAMEYSIIKDQVKKADKQYRNEVATISANGSSKRANAEAIYLNNEYLPKLENAISLFVYTCLNKYLTVLIENNLFDSNVLKYIDIKKSQGILKNLSLTNNKISVINEAFAVCPFNANIFIELIKLGKVTESTIQTTCVLNLKDDLIQYIKSNIYSKNIDSDYKYRVSNISNYIKCYSLFTNQDEITTKKDLFANNVYSIRKDYSNIYEYCKNEKSLEAFVENESVLSDEEALALAKRIVKSVIKNDDFKFLVDECGYSELLSNINYTESEFSSKQELDNNYIEKIYSNLIIISNRNKKKKDEIELAQKIAEENAIADKEKQKEKNKKLIIRISVLSAVLIVIFSVLFAVVNKAYIQPNKIYTEAIELFDNGQYSKALKEFEQIKNFKDSEEKIDSCTNEIEKENQDLKDELLVKYAYLEGDWYSDFVICNNDYEYYIDSANIKLIDEKSKAYAELKFTYNLKDYIKDEIGNCDFKFTIDLQNLKVVNTNQTYDGDVLIDLADTLKITLVGMNDNRYYKSRTNLEIEFYQTEYNANLSGIFDKETFENISYIGKKLSETKYNSYDVSMSNSKYFNATIDYQDKNSRRFLSEGVSSSALVFSNNKDDMKDCKCEYLELKSIGHYSLDESKVLLESILGEKAYDIKDKKSYKIDAKMYYSNDKACCIQVTSEGDKSLVIKIFDA